MISINCELISSTPIDHTAHPGIITGTLRLVRHEVCVIVNVHRDVAKPTGITRSAADK
ncbi:MAG: hypothetical protein JJU41_11915 [Bacteroidetes bacterium]|nr:hypothetical protein [Bacteroidota bacterium]